MYAIYVLMKHNEHVKHGHVAVSSSGAEPERVLYPFVNKRDKCVAPHRPERVHVPPGHSPPEPRVRSVADGRELPWTLAGGSKCALFDMACGAKERAAKAAMAE